MTPAEWQEGVDAAHVMLQIHGAKSFGLVTGGPEVNVERCLELLHAGRELGVVLRPDALEQWIHDQKTYEAKQREHS